MKPRMYGFIYGGASRLAETVGYRKLIMKKWYPLISAGWVQSGVYQDFGIHGFREMRARLGTGVVPEEKGTKWERIDWRLFPSKARVVPNERIIVDSIL